MSPSCRLSAQQARAARSSPASASGSKAQDLGWPEFVELAAELGADRAASAGHQDPFAGETACPFGQFGFHRRAGQ